MDKKNPQLIQGGLKKPRLYSLESLAKVERPLSASELSEVTPDSEACSNKTKGFPKFSKC